MKQTGFPSTFGARLKWVRERHGLTLQEFGALIDFGRSYLSRLENEKRAKVSAQFIFSVCRIFGLHEDWLVEGTGDPFLLERQNRLGKKGNLPMPHHQKTFKEQEVYVAATYAAGSILSQGGTVKDLANWLVRLLEKRDYTEPIRLEIARILATEIFMRMDTDGCEKMLPGTAASGLGEEAINAFAMAEHDWTPEHDAKADLTNKANALTNDGVQSMLPKLIERLKRATEERGKKVELAECLGVHRQMVTDWLSGKQKPGGEITLRMLAWVELQERKNKALAVR